MAPLTGQRPENGTADPRGRQLCDAGREETVVWGDGDPAAVEEARAVGDYLLQRRPELYD